MAGLTSYAVFLPGNAALPVLMSRPEEMTASLARSEKAYFVCEKPERSRLPAEKKPYPVRQAVYVNPERFVQL